METEQQRLARRRRELQNEIDKLDQELEETRTRSDELFVDSVLDNMDHWLAVLEHNTAWCGERNDNATQCPRCAVLYIQRYGNMAAPFRFKIWMEDIHWR